MEAVLIGVLGTAVLTLALVPLSLASGEINHHDEQVRQRDDDLEEWVIDHHRGLIQRWKELEQQAIAAGVERGGTLPAGRAVTRTLLLYEYREEWRQARNFVRQIDAEERWTHHLMRRLRRRPFPELTVPDRAEVLIDYWSEGTGRNALTWRLEDIVAELPVRATSQARDPDSPASPTQP